MIPSVTAGPRRAERAVGLAAAALLVVATPARAAPADIPATTPGAPPSFLELSDRLRGVGSYSACVVEALRYASDHPALREAGFDRAALCLSLAGRHADARRVMLTMPALGTPLTDVGRLRVCLAEVFLPRDAAPAVCPALVAGAATSPLGARARHALAMRDLHAARWDDARPALAAETNAPDDAVLARWREQDEAWVQKHDALPRKSPWLAAGLSAIVPGLGRAYIGRWQDGVVSFLLVGVMGGLAAQGFHEDGTSSVRGWILAGTAGLFYVGNVYGSAVGAVVQRRDAEAALQEKVDDDYRRRLEP
jgi:hypothetical protein